VRRFTFPYTEAQLLKGLDANTVHADELAILAPKEWDDSAAPDRNYIVWLDSKND
jgi:hypothetical protein